MHKRLVLAILCCGLLTAQIAPDRRVEKNVLVSDHDPPIRIQLPATVQYLGALRWRLYDVADCELHAFVEVDPKEPEKKRVERLYWVQFESYLPTKPELHYDYDSPRHTTIGGMDFYVDTWVRREDAKTQPGSDREHLQSLVRARGYMMPLGMMYVRLVHLLDQQKRRELMIIYGENLVPLGLTADELAQGGSAHDRWPAIEKDLVERAQQKLVLELRAAQR